jgi:hypothetical protein
LTCRETPSIFNNKNKIVSVVIHYSLVGSGWAECLIEIDGQSVHLTASYLSDALADLLEAVTLVVRGVEESTASFAAEPEEYRWRLQRISPNRLQVSIIWFTDLWKHRPDAEGKVILQAECRLRTFAGAVLSASQQVLSVHGLAEYRENWVNYEFPIAIQQKLQTALNADRQKNPVSQPASEC